jgi:hypothetical protein
MQTYVPAPRATNQRPTRLTGVCILVVSVVVGVIAPVVLG